MTRLLRINRPVRVRRDAYGRWGWSCRLCPLPWCDRPGTADTWAQAFDDADEHVRLVHQYKTTDACGGSAA